MKNMTTEALEFDLHNAKADAERWENEVRCALDVLDRQEIKHEPRRRREPMAEIQQFREQMRAQAERLIAETPSSDVARNVLTLCTDHARLEAEVERLRGALMWCSGSDDFQPGGKAWEGWLKGCAPLITPERAATPAPTSAAPERDERAIEADEREERT